MIKLIVQENFFDDRHYVWCSENWDSSALPRTSLAAHVAPSSNPRQIYEKLKAAVQRCDRHDDTIVRVRGFYVGHAEKLRVSGALTPKAAAELTVFVNTADFSLWSPVLYLIDRDAVAGQLEEVDPKDRASHGPEYIIPSLHREHFQTVEF